MRSCRWANGNGAFRPHLVIMAKEAVAGRVKTRLARDIGVVAATAAYRQMLKRTIDHLQDARWRTVLAVTPDSGVASRTIAARCARQAQGRGDLGARMQRVFDQAGRGPVVIIGTDIPDISRSDIAAAWCALGSADAVIGPSGDGGYWLIGLKRRPHVARIFRDVRWSSAYALADTMRNLAGLDVAVLDEREDVDDGASHRAQRNVIGRRISGGVRPGAA